MSIMLSLHIAFLLLWSAALVYFPRLLVRHANDDDPGNRERAMLMQRTLYAYLMTPSALLAVAAGTWLIFERGFSGGWLQVKLTLVLLMVWLHTYCGYLMGEYRHGREHRRLVWFRLLPLVLLLLITAVVLLVTWKPF